MSNRHRSHGEANEDAEAAPDASGPLAGHGRPSRGLRKNLCLVFKEDYDEKEIGRARIRDGQLQISTQAMEWLRPIRVGGWKRDPDGKQRVQELVPADGNKYLMALRRAVAANGGIRVFVEPEPEE